MIKIFLVDDHNVVRTGIRNILTGVDDFSIIGEASSGEEVLNSPDIASADIVMMDIKMTGIGGMETTKRLLQVNPKLKVIILTAFKEDPYPHHLIQVGAKGYLPKDCHVDEMVKAIRKVHAGEFYVNPLIAQKLALKVANDPLETISFSLLSRREMEVVLLLIEGFGISEIAATLHLSPKTVGTYRYRSLQKLGIKNNVELIHLAVQHGLLEQFRAS